MDNKQQPTLYYLLHGFIRQCSLSDKARQHKIVSIQELGFSFGRKLVQLTADIRLVQSIEKTVYIEHVFLKVFEKVFGKSVPPRINDFSKKVQVIQAKNNFIQNIFSDDQHEVKEYRGLCIILLGALVKGCLEGLGLVCHVTVEQMKEGIFYQIDTVEC